MTFEKKIRNAVFVAIVALTLVMLTWFAFFPITATDGTIYDVNDLWWHPAFALAIIIAGLALALAVTTNKLNYTFLWALVGIGTLYMGEHGYESAFGGSSIVTFATLMQTILLAILIAVPVSLLLHFLSKRAVAR